jgi:Bacteriocin-protection, YdeI or OmpD-Associated/Domain of unknown function (DUF1905)
LNSKPLVFKENPMRFRAILQLAGKTATGIQVPDQIVSGLGSSKKPAVRVTLNGYTYRSTVAVMGGVFMLPVSAEHRAGAGVAAGEEVTVDLELDAAPREVNLPPDFAALLEGDADAKRFFEGLSYSRKQWYVLPIEQAKTPETRARRLEKAINMLREGQR